MKHILTWGVIILCCSLSTGCMVRTETLLQEDLRKRVALDREAMFKNQEPLKAPITLEEAMARSIKYNLDHRLKIMEHALSLRQVDLTTFDMLPRLVAAAGYTERDSHNASSSMNVFTNQQSLSPSTSQDKGHFNSDLTLTWNILDFGVSYFQAKQQSDRAHIMKERRRKVVHSIMQQIRHEYWLASGAQQLEGRFDPLLKEVQKALQDSSNIEKERLRPPLEALTYRKTLLETMKQLEGFRDELAQAKPRLASLMNLPIGQSFTIVPSPLIIPKGPDAVHYLEIRALLQRPELIEADYNERISVYETRKAIARMLPGIELSVGGHFDNNSFLVNQTWIEGGARLTWNLMTLLSGPSQYKIATSQIEIAQAQRLALSVAIITQVHVAYQNFYSRKQQYLLSEQLQDIETRIHEQTMNQTRSGSQNRLNEIRSATAALMAEYRSYQNYASLQSACGQIIATLGDDPLPETLTSHEIKALSGAIGARLYAPTSLCSPLATGSASAVKPNPVTNKPTQLAPEQTVPAKVAPTQTTPGTKPSAPATSLSITPGNITKGQTTKLAWVSKNAAKCDIQPEVGIVKPEGDILIAPSETTTYTATCDGEGGKATDTATIVVAQQVLVSAAPKASSTRLPDPMILSLAFDTSGADIRPDHSDTLKKLADLLIECPEATCEIAGHTDDVRFPDNLYGNLQLSRDRANNIRTYLITTHGIDPKRLSTKGFGSTKPVADNRTEEGRQKNRRIEVNFKCAVN